MNGGEIFFLPRRQEARTRNYCAIDERACGDWVAITMCTSARASHTLISLLKYHLTIIHEQPYSFNVVSVYAFTKAAFEWRAHLNLLFKS